MVIMDKTLKKKERDYSDVESFFFFFNRFYKFYMADDWKKDKNYTNVNLGLNLIC